MSVDIDVSKNDNLAEI